MLRASKHRMRKQMDRGVSADEEEELVRNVW